MPTTTPLEAVTPAARCPGAERILAAARTLFAQRGLSGVSIQQIADAAEVSKANVFHHFATKQALYRAVLEEAAEEFRQLLATLSSQTTASGLSEFSLRHLIQLLQDPGTTWLFLRALSDPQPTTQRRLAEEIASEVMMAVISAIDELRNAHVVPRQSETTTLAMTLLGANLFYFQLHNILPKLGDHPALRTPQAFTRSVTQLLVGAAHPDSAPLKKAKP
ncbi:MAG: TetR/AcrR family transcriptional regulator [Proteobacteria bacterium]|nr:MAG: TetR/AcrR family transcriptional regulator [Pseudomonadota bacterium]